jgi:hypothetical protein
LTIRDFLGFIDYRDRLVDFPEIFSDSDIASLPKKDRQRRRCAIRPPRSSRTDCEKSTA